jgi:hypothetical protein
LGLPGCRMLIPPENASQYLQRITRSRQKPIINHKKLTKTM